MKQFRSGYPMIHQFLKKPILGALILICSGCIAGDQSMEPLLTTAYRNNALSSMVPIIDRSIRRKDSESVLFHGCYDWHSAVHGHFALLRIARITGRHAKEARYVSERLEPDLIDKEAAYMKANPSFEMPYGRAWFLRLAMEHALWAKTRKPEDATKLKKMADSVAASLRVYIKQSDLHPSEPEYRNQSWAICQLNAYYCWVQNEAGVEEVNRLVQKHFLNPENPSTWGNDYTRPEFFSRAANWTYLIAATQDGAGLKSFLKTYPVMPKSSRPVKLLMMDEATQKKWLKAYPDLRGTLDPGLALPNAHHLGMNWSRAWCLAALWKISTDAKERKNYAQAYQAHVEQGLKDHKKYAGSFLLYDHWVPQFAVYALTEGVAEAPLDSK